MLVPQLVAADYRPDAYDNGPDGGRRVIWAQNL
jgi:hypothetical protein